MNKMIDSSSNRSVAESTERGHVGQHKRQSIVDDNIEGTDLFDGDEYLHEEPIIEPTSLLELPVPWIGYQLEPSQSDFLKLLLMFS